MIKEEKKLRLKDIIALASMLFGLFFGAGNIIFPVSMGQLAGRNVWLATAGFLVTGVGLPLLAVAALGSSHKDGLFELAGRAGRLFGFLFTCTLYLTIGPFFAIPRCATVSYTVGIQQLFPSVGQSAALAVFSLLFFAVVLFFSLRPGEILVWIGKVLNPLFLAFLAVLIIRALISPAAAIHALEPAASYQEGAFFTGLLEGYNTMDALAGLAFGIIVVDAVRRLGVGRADDVAKYTMLSGIFSSILMSLVYVLVAVVGAQSLGLFPSSSNGGVALAQIAAHYFGPAGAFLLAATITLACLKTAVGLITSCAETFEKLFPKGPSYRLWAVSFCLLSFLIANLGLDAIIAWSLPVLMFLYPLVIVEILLTLGGRFFSDDPVVLRTAFAFTAAAALLDFLSALPQDVRQLMHLDAAIASVQAILPLSAQGFGWILPSLVGLGFALIRRSLLRKPNGEES